MNASRKKAGKLSVKVTLRPRKGTGHIKNMCLCDDCSDDCGGYCGKSLSSRKLTK